MILSRARSSCAWTGAGRNKVRCSSNPPIRRSATLAISSRPNTPTTWSTSGNCSSKIVFLALGQTASDDHAPDVSRDRFRSSISSITPIDSCRRSVDEPTGVDDHQIGLLGIGHEGIAVLSREARASARYRPDFWNSPG